MSFTVFGYGSLVNRATLPPILNAEPLAVSGWRRAWRCSSRTERGGVCALSVVPDEDCVIEGLALTFEDGYWPQITARERRYAPVPLAERPEIIIFRALPEVDRWGDADHPVSLSYIDCILQGFIREFGEAGLARFVETTEGWHVPILGDRDRPRYPRAQSLDQAECDLIDRALRSVDARVLEVEYEG